MHSTRPTSARATKSSSKPAKLGDLSAVSAMSIAVGTGQGSGHARLVYWYLCSYERKAGRVWPSNPTISRHTGMCETGVERALLKLAAAGDLEIVHEERPRWKSHRGRSIVLRAGAPTLPWPSGEYTSALWTLGRAVRCDDARPVALVELAVAAWLVASLANGKPITDDRSFGFSMKVLKRLTGSSGGGDWNVRLRELELAGAIKREGKTWRSGLIVVADLLSALERRQLDPVTVAGRALVPALNRIVEFRNSHVIWPGHKLLAKMTNLAESSVKAGLRHLADVGYVKSERRKRNDGWHTEYLILDGTPESAAEAAEWNRDPHDKAAARWDDPAYWAVMESLAAEHDGHEAANDAGTEWCAA